MDKLKSVDLLLGQAIETVVDTSKLIEDSSSLDTRKNMVDIGTAIHSLWEIRTRIYEIDPSLTPDVVNDFKSNELDFNRLDELASKAEGVEGNGDLDSARNYYMKLLKESSLNHFRLLAEAGLYRTTATNK
ncbi:hypothetical protein [Pseudoalteromonas fuliginea]|uniref:Uncharacterized protein n=1 Tax=Pseudoalteromonas fuliginea TaxID=1872678 RepID=A0ABQ6RIJ8_9GAMM|nr:hypothetical protein [Pseudoalteromonas fuliginea]KAA1156219.1 hypothetical protein EU509_10540 [Pseudoalteromonas fuliginea]KAA1167408.1 hypothetical protein EUZ79_10530 [Pseudoalteromonas fuliginea]